MYVTPCTGVWIEMGKFNQLKQLKASHSLHGSVDWNIFLIFTALSCCWSLPARECGLKYCRRYTVRQKYSHSLHGSVDWNLNSCRLLNDLKASLPARECGLKSNMYRNYILYLAVTPCTGVWIEIGCKSQCMLSVSSLPARECGLKSHCLLC